ncbi:hypothetical protein C5B90_03935 [Haloferax sp. Atlit-12N]|uniref:DUF7310 family coiled-coil domain-containing protein n=1 Tax=Haloferax sp. Atlit-12N TaxID=2077203 RepID=UPI000E24C808|nr:hypothetical protein [Haloferax sp. Atlit-12N]RDZ65520.1 hypothetical protein C5B90_03935 [Haloferax sp. Atlit-12N]
MTTDPVHFDADGDTDTGTPAARGPVAADHTADRTADLAARLDAVERTITDGDADFSSLEDLASVERRVSELESAVESLTERLDEVDAATQAMRGYLGGVRAVNEDVERRANAALAKAESLEAELVDETASPAPPQSADALASEAASLPQQTTGAYDDSPRRDETTETAVHAGRDSHVARDSRAGDSRNDATGSRADSADRGLAARLRDAL